MNLYVGNIDFNVSEEQINELFSEYGEVASAKIITDRDSGRSKGFAFVEMPNDDEARTAIEELNGHEMGSRKIFVSEARPREEGRGGGGFNKGGGGGFRDRDRGGRGGNRGY